MYRGNNVALSSHFNITVYPGEVFTFKFQLQGDPLDPGRPFSLDVVRRNLPQDFEVRLAFDDENVGTAIRNARGFVPVAAIGIAEIPAGALSDGGSDIRLSGERGQLEFAASTGHNPITARIVVRAPDIDSRYYGNANRQRQYLIVNTADGDRTLGGLTLNIRISPDATPVKNVIYTVK